MIITDFVFSLVGALRGNFAFCLELATGTLLDGFSMSFSSSLVGSKNDLMTFLKNLLFHTLLIKFALEGRIALHGMNVTC